MRHEGGSGAGGWEWGRRVVVRQDGGSRAGEWECGN